MPLDPTTKIAHLKTVLETIPDDVIALSMDNKLIVWNEVFSKKWALPEKWIETEAMRVLLFVWIQDAILRARREAEMAAALQQALKQNEFELYYQPLIDLNSDNVIGVEALIRWNHPTLGFLYPNAFIPLAETTGLIFPIGDWVLKTACQQAVQWQKTLCPALNIAVNISGHQFRDENFVNRVYNILTETGLEPSFLELEVTEGAIAQKIPDIAKKMAELRSLGVHLSIDDFGTEYASLSYIKYFPFDKVKIAKIFIDGISESHHANYDSIIIEAIIQMAQKMGMKVLAEGIEKPEQVAFLRKHHGDQVQGYYFSQPLNLKECTAWLERKSGPR